MFLLIPTAHPDINKYINVYYLLDTGSPVTTLTHRALCAIHQKKYSELITFQRGVYKVGGELISILPSNPDPQSKNSSNSFYNVNILGVNFLKCY
jgi:hypothetical protein